MSITSCAERQWRIAAAADGIAPERFYCYRVSRREQSLRPSHTAVAYGAGDGSPGEPGVGDLFAA